MKKTVISIMTIGALAGGAYMLLNPKMKNKVCDTMDDVSNEIGKQMDQMMKKTKTKNNK